MNTPPTPGTPAKPVAPPCASVRDCPRCGPGALPAPPPPTTRCGSCCASTGLAPGPTPQATPTALTVVATLASLCGVPGAPPAMLHHRGAKTALRDLTPLCDTCHHDVHEGHRVLRLRNGRHINDTGWSTTPHPRSPSSARH